MNKFQLNQQDSVPRAIVIGASAGGAEALTKILSTLPLTYTLPILIAQHLHAQDRGGFAEQLDHAVSLPVTTGMDKQRIEPGHAYVAPADYHMLVEQDGFIALSIDDKVNWSRPSIDVLFDSAARVWQTNLTAIILSGANYDGTQGLAIVKQLGGRTLAQYPATARHPVMPQAAINAGVIDEVLTLEQISEQLIELDNKNTRRTVTLGGTCL